MTNKLNEFFEITWERASDGYESIVVLRDKITKEEVFRWDDDANINYSEDLTWGRNIGILVDEAFKLGLKYAKKKNIEEKVD